jgi:hypothetical protein
VLAIAVCFWDDASQAAQLLNADCRHANSSSGQATPSTQRIVSTLAFYHIISLSLILTTTDFDQLLEMQAIA